MPARCLGGIARHVRVPLGQEEPKNSKIQEHEMPTAGRRYQLSDLDSNIHVKGFDTTRMITIMSKETYIINNLVTTQSPT